MVLTTNPLPNGTIVLRNSVGRALRTRPAGICASAVVDCSGGFRVGDVVNITFRGADGGQFAIATAVADIDAEALRRRVGMSINHDTAPPDDPLVVAKENFKLLWPVLDIL